MNEVVLSVLALLAGIGVFMFGMKFMSDGLERSAGKGLKKLLGKITNNRFAGVGVGAAVTGIIQSSAATTVMVMGFVNAGLMTLVQATAIIMGANIGTTVTGIIASLSAFPIMEFFGVLVLVGAAMVMFSKKAKFKHIGYILGGLGLVFVGLDLMSGAFKNETISSVMTNAFTSIDFPLLLILVGIVFTALIQSSSAVTGILVTMVGAGAIPLDCSLFIVLGSNIGTCVTALLASIGANTNAKRVAFIHLTYNVVGTIMFTAVIWPLSDQVVWLLQTMFPQPEFQVAMFHFFFNFFTTLMLLPFVKVIVRFAEFCVKEKRSADDDQPHMYFIDDRFLKTPPIAVAQVKREVDHMAEMAKTNLKRSMSALLTGDISEGAKIRKDEQKINFVNLGVAKYLIKLASESLTRSDEKFVGSLHHVVSDIERIADHSVNFIEEAEAMSESDNAFTEDALAELEGMYDKVMAMFDEAMNIFDNSDVAKLNDFSSREQEIDMLKAILGNNHIQRLNAGGCTAESGTHFFAIISALERIADHLTNIAFSIKSPSGSQREAMEKIAEEQRHRAHERKHASVASAASLGAADALQEKTDVPSDDTEPHAQ